MYISGKRDLIIFEISFFRSVAIISILVNTSFTLLAFILLFSDVVVYWSSYTHIFREDVLRKVSPTIDLFPLHPSSPYVQNGYGDRITMQTVFNLSSPNNPYYNRSINEHRRMNIEYGTTWHNWCWVS